MKTETREQRLKKMWRFARVLNAWHVVYGIVFVNFLPYLTIGTRIHESIVDLARYSTLGVILIPFYAKIITLILGWFAKTGRTLESPTFIPILLVCSLIGTSITYVMFRIFRHEGNWEATLAYSSEDAFFSLISNLLLAVYVGLCTLTLTSYREGESIVFRQGKPAPFWVVTTALLYVPILLILIGLVRYLVHL